MDTTGAAPATAEKKDVETKPAEGAPAAQPASTPAATVGDVPDPDEDDLDDLDGMLREMHRCTVVYWFQ